MVPDKDELSRGTTLIFSLIDNGYYPFSYKYVIHYLIIISLQQPLTFLK